MRAVVFATLFAEMESPTLLFADDNSSYRRVARRKAEEEARRAARRMAILDTLRRLKREASDPAVVDARERERRHSELMERYPPLY